ncbi:hypothetical protein OB905_13130 [Halobacteria archaeon AArc-dxtr1]|nr:hypothetical protein [Halobacteria archaeon AArc-dxtr1]
MATKEPVDDGPGPFDDVSAPIDIWHKFPGLTDSKMFHEFASRLTSGRDMHVIITAAAETGVGKTTLAVTLSLLWDMNWWTAEKATLDPRDYEMMYDEVAPGSVLLLDEVQDAVDSRRAGSRDNVNLSQAFATKRYRQVFGMMTAPSKGWVDGRIGSDSADYWIQCQETDKGEPKGEAKVYRLKNNEHYEESYSKRTETISWPKLDWHPEFKKLHRKKVESKEGKTQSNYVHRSEHVDALEKAKERTRRARDNWWMMRLYQQTDLSQGDIGDIVGINQATVSRRINEGEIDDA